MVGFWLFWVRNHLYPCFSSYGESKIVFPVHLNLNPIQKRTRTVVPHNTTKKKLCVIANDDNINKSRRLRVPKREHFAYPASGRWYGDCRLSTGTELVPIILCRNCRLGVKPSCTRLTAGTSTNVNWSLVNINAGSLSSRFSFVDFFDSKCKEIYTKLFQ